MSPQADTTPDFGLRAEPATTVGTEPATSHAEATITIEYETFGALGDPAVLLVMGFGTQLLGWDADFCRMLAARGPLRDPVRQPRLRSFDEVRRAPGSTSRTSSPP